MQMRDIFLEQIANGLYRSILKEVTRAAAAIIESIVIFLAISQLIPQKILYIKA